MSFLKKLKAKKKGFTLIELIVVIAILGILAAILLPRFSGFTDSAREKTVTSEAKAIYTSLEAYYAENGKYPATIAELPNTKNTEKVSDYAPTATGATELFKYSKDNVSVKCTADGTVTKIASVSK
ncbi:type II secretion system protein [Hathewaya histolytica]|uniref:type II secretion system protein n=1 Tax=Hathewaya histolytica TaxID=1498 RepID=UPI003B67E446